MSSSQFLGRSWGEIVVRQKLNANETLLSEDNSYDLLRCRHCRRVVKCGYVDIHLKKCAQHYANLPPKNPSPAKITMAKYYYDVLPSDNSKNPQLTHSINTRFASEPPHKKRKVNKNKHTKNSSAPVSDTKIIVPPSIRSKRHNTKSIYNDLFHGLRSYSSDIISTNNPKKRGTKKKLKLRLNRPSKTIHSTDAKHKEEPLDNMMRNQKTSERDKRHTNNNNNNAKPTNTRAPLTLATSAWEHEEEMISDAIKSECSIHYVTYHQFWNQYAKTLDRYAVECTTRSNTQVIKLLDQQISRYNSHHLRPVIKHLLGKEHYKEGGREFEDYQALQQLVGISYNIPECFSNGIYPPSASFRSFVDDGKYQSSLQRECHDFWFKSQPLSPLRYISTELHRKYVKTQQKVWTARQLQIIQRQKQEIQKKKQQQQQQQQQNYMTIPLINKMKKSNNAASAQRRAYGSVHGAYNGAALNGSNASLAQNVPTLSYTQRPITPINRHRIASHSTYNGHVSNASINTDTMNTLQTQRSYGGHSVNSTNTQQSHASISSLASRGNMNAYNQAMNGAASIHSNNNNHNNRAPPQAQYPSYPSIPNVPSPFANTGSAGPPSVNSCGNSGNNAGRNVNNMGYVQAPIAPRNNYRNNGHVSRRNNASLRPATYENNAQTLNYNASPSDTAITNLSAATYTNNTASSQPPIPLNTTHINTNNNNNINNNPSPQSINSNHTSYTAISQRSATPMTMNYQPRNANNTIYSNTNSLMIPPTNGALQRGETNDAEMFMPSIGC